MTISSDFPVPELGPASPAAPVDLTISRARFEELPPQSFDFSGPIKWLHWEAVGRFAVHPSGLVEFEPSPGADERLISFPLLGPVMATVLEQRGMLVLHASAIALEDRAVIFLGNKTAGKSTTAAAMVAAGCRLLSDDVVAISFDAEGRGWVLPAFDQIKLSDEATRDIGLSSEMIDQRDLFPGVIKSQHRIGPGFAAERMEVGLICILDRDSEPVLMPASGAEALERVIQFSYLVRFRLEDMPREVVAKHLRQCSAVATRYPVAQLTVPSSISRLAEALPVIRDAIQSD
ncbi:hypothetical protein [Roseitranquillus sediminis]|uniref:hypothetical protein n=1 Tax=Roseitranquillus sediminis TaxID=2809051 RepID=UPI001D0C4B06|nr:hypothetical protein [Roseitranquillus sediminis]MBM9594026.1 hypothetical protein [Roseitranquillus sediminis]